jgi:hypothetical protein
MRNRNISCHDITCMTHDMDACTHVHIDFDHPLIFVEYDVTGAVVIPFLFFSFLFTTSVGLVLKTQTSLLFRSSAWSAYVRLFAI